MASATHQTQGYDPYSILRNRQTTLNGKEQVEERKVSSLLNNHTVLRTNHISYQPTSFGDNYGKSRVFSKP